MTLAPSVSVHTAMQALVRYSEKIDDLLDPIINQEHTNAYRILEAMVKYAPTTAGSDNIASSINECETDDQLQQLGIMYRDNLILPFRTQGGTTPAVSSNASLDVPLERRDVSALLESPMRDSQLREAVLERDNRRCVITGAYDNTRYGPVFPAGADPAAFNAPLEVAHIIPFALTKSDIFLQTEKASAVWQTIRSFSGIGFEELNGQEMNKLGNMITLWNTVHDVFGRLDIWLEPVETESNAYYLRKVGPYVLGSSLPPSGHIIRLTSTGPRFLPNPKYIAIHAACAKVAHVSGAAAYIDSLCNKWEDTSVLSSDGSSANIFHQRLHLARILAH